MLTVRLAVFSLSVIMSVCAVVRADAKEPIARLSGIAAVKDGDGLLFGDVEIRLRGIAAPEDNHRKRDVGGRASSEHLRALADGQKVVCELDGTVTSDRSAKRPVGVCFVESVDLGEAQVASGNARDCPRFSGGLYKSAETSAREAGRDLARVYPLPSYCDAR